jgi:glucose-6-phosphate isomerase
VGFADLPADGGGADACAALAGEVSGRFSDLVVLGIGGSSLGARALVTALGGRRRMRLHFPDNADPASFGALIDGLDLGGTAWVTITKSGGTAETLSQHFVLRERVLAAHGEAGYRERCIAITDPEKGLLRTMAREEKLRTLPVPPSVGGRFSALSAVGLFPAACAGIDIAALLSGAAGMEERCREADPLQNPALLLAATLHLLDVKAGRRLHVFMPYADALRDLGDWFVQLWAESLGKSATVGPTPVRAVGATDQHSTLQLLMEGPQDKVVIFVAPGERPRLPIPVPEPYRRHADVAYLAGHTMGELIDAELKATRAALARAGRPSLTIDLPRIDPRSVGELLMLLELATAYAGGLYGVNAFDQPGVEAGKRYAQALLGRADLAKLLPEIAELPAEIDGELILA